MHKAKENLKPTYGVLSIALGGETGDKVEGGWVDMSLYDLAVGYAVAKNVASAGVITLQLLEATGAAGQGSQTIAGKTDTFTSTHTTATDILQAEVRGEELTDGYRYVGMRVSTGANGTEYVAGVMVQERARYAQQTLP